jgi:hypothetical protein
MAKENRQKLDLFLYGYDSTVVSPGVTLRIPDWKLSVLMAGGFEPIPTFSAPRIIREISLDDWSTQVLRTNLTNEYEQSLDEFYSN